MQPMTHSIDVAARPETATGGWAHRIEPLVTRMSMTRSTPAFIGIGGSTVSSAIPTADVVAAMVQLMPDSAGPSDSVRSKTIVSPEIVSRRRIVLGSPVHTSWSTRSLAS